MAQDYPGLPAAATISSSSSSAEDEVPRLNATSSSSSETNLINTIDNEEVQQHRTSSTVPSAAGALHADSTTLVTNTSGDHRTVPAAATLTTAPLLLTDGRVMCLVCQEAVNFGNISDAPLAVSMLCGHMFHENCLSNWVDVRNVVMYQGKKCKEFRNCKTHTAQTGNETCPTCRMTCQKRLIQRIYPEWQLSSNITSRPTTSTASLHVNSDDSQQQQEQAAAAQAATELFASRMLGALSQTLAERNQLRTLGEALMRMVAQRLNHVEECLSRLFSDTAEVGYVVRTQLTRMRRLLEQMHGERNECHAKLSEMSAAYGKARQLCRRLLKLANKRIELFEDESSRSTHRELNRRLFALCKQQDEQIQALQKNLLQQQTHKRKNVKEIMKRYVTKKAADDITSSDDQEEFCSGPQRLSPTAFTADSEGFETKFIVSNHNRRDGSRLNTATTVQHSNDDEYGTEDAGEALQSEESGECVLALDTDGDEVLRQHPWRRPRQEILTTSTAFISDRLLLQCSEGLLEEHDNIFTTDRQQTRSRNSSFNIRNVNLERLEDFLMYERIVSRQNSNSS